MHPFEMTTPVSSCCPLTAGWPSVCRSAAVDASQAQGKRAVFCRLDRQKMAWLGVVERGAGVCWHRVSL